MKPEELQKLNAYFKRVFNPDFEIKPRPRKDDSCELYKGEEFIGVISRDEDEGEISYHLSVAILDIDLD